MFNPQHIMATAKQNLRILIACDDAKGLVYKFSKIFYHNNLNIDSNQEFVDKNKGRFFMRSVVTGDFESQELERKLREVAPKNAEIQVKVPKKKKIVILVTKESHVLGDTLIRHSAGQLDAEIQAVIGNHLDLSDLVKRFDLPFYHVPTANISRKQHEQKITTIIQSLEHDYVVLAKYMRILSADFVATFAQKIINIHHSFLPAFIGANPYKQAFERGVKIIGATAHFVTSDLDEGPIIAQNIIPVNHRFNWQDMQAAGRDVEKTVLARALNLVLNDRVFICGNKTIVF